MGGPVRRSGTIVLFAFVLLLALFAISSPSASAWTFDCTIRLNSSCLANETMLVRLNSSEAGQAPNNSHAQLANYSGGLYNYSVCCWTDSFRNLGNACTNTYTSVLKLAESNNSHVQAGNMTGYQYSACFNLTGTLACEYPNDACSSGYTGIVSIASSELADANLTNAHVATPTFYKRRVCCAIANTPPVITSLVVNSTGIYNSTAYNVTAYVTATDVDQGNNISFAYDWRVNGTSIAVLNLNFDVNNSNGTGSTRDYTGFGNNASVHGAFWNQTGGYNLTGGYTFNGISDHLNTSAGTGLSITNVTNFSLSVWVRTASTTTPGQPIVANNGTNGRTWLGLDTSQTACGGSDQIYSTLGGTALCSGTSITTSWTHLVLTVRELGVVDDNVTIYVNGAYAASALRSVETLTSAKILIGTNASLAGWFNGTLDSVTIYNRTLSAQQALALYNNRTDLIVSQELNATQNWTACVTSNDGYSDGSRNCSTSHLIVGKTAPDKVNLSYPLHNNQSVFERFVNFSWTTAVERDGDQVNYTLYVVLVGSGSCSVQNTITNILTTNYTYGELCVDQLYNWTVNVCDVDGCSGNTTTHNFTIASVIGIRLAANLTDYGVLALLQNNATDITNGPSPLILENNGNVYVNVTLNASNSPFTSVALGNSAFQYRIADNETGSFNTSGSQITYTPVPSGETPAIKQLNHSEASDTIRIHTNITVPSAEPPGAKTTNLTLRASVSQTP